MSGDTVIARDAETIVVQLERPGGVVMVEAIETVVLKEDPASSVVLLEDDSEVVISPHPEMQVVLASGQQGPPGIPGPAGGQVLQRTAGQDTSALVVVYEDLFGAVWPADPDVETDVLALLGVTVSAAQGGQPINVQRLGVIDDASWSFAPGGRVYLAGQGRLTQEPPQAGYDVLIGTAVSPTRLLLNIQDPIALE